MNLDTMSIPSANNSSILLLGQNTCIHNVALNSGHLIRSEKKENFAGSFGKTVQRKDFAQTRINDGFGDEMIMAKN